jgi:menaquinone-9 beta-reductase
VEWSLPQLTAEDVPEGGWDVGVIGAGPAGALCALSLARAGRRCLILDRAQFPRHKACGDVLLPEALRVLEQNGLLDMVQQRARALDVISVFSPSLVEIEAPGRYLTIRRYDLDALLMQAAVAAGATFIQASVRDVHSSSDEVAIELLPAGRRVRARFAVLATGAVVALPDRLGMIERKPPDAIAARCYVRSTARLDRVMFSYDRALVPGFGWVVPVREDVFNVGCGIVIGGGGSRATDLKRLLGRFIQQFAPARELMRASTQISAIRGAPLRCGLSGFRRAKLGRTLGVGEVVSTTYPFTGEGIAKAMSSGLLAARVLNKALYGGEVDVAGEYELLLDRELRPAYEGYATAQAWLSRPWVNDLMARRIRKSLYLQREVASFLTAAGDPRRLYSLRAVLKSWWC